MKGYYKNPEKTSEAIIDGWLHSGDIGVRGSDGFISLVDRKKDMIVSGGENIYPAEVENALMSNEEILDAAVVGVPDKKWGESTKAFVVLSPGSSLNDKDIISYTKT